MQREATTTAEYTLLDQQLMRKATNYFAWQARMAEQQIGRRVIEIGCGTGNFTEHLTSCEYVCGLDVVGECVEASQTRFTAHKSFEFRELDVLDPDFLSLGSVGADTVVCLNVLEHIRDDRLALQHMHSVLVPRGRAILILPAFESAYGPIDAKLGHFRRYSKRGWQALAESCGFELTVCRYFNSVGLLGWMMNAHIFKREVQSASQIALFDSTIVPLLSRVESMIEPPFGQSIFTVLTKRW